MWNEGSSKALSPRLYLEQEIVVLVSFYPSPKMPFDILQAKIAFLYLL